MFGFERSQVWAVGIGTIVFWLLLIGLAVFIAATMVDWEAIKKLRAKRKSGGWA